MAKLNRIDPSTLSANPRCSLSAWERYRSVVVAAYRQHPKPYIFPPANMSPATVCSRLRDAIRGALAFGYDIDSGISGDDLLRWYGEIIIKNDKETVYLGPRTSVATALELEHSSPSSLSFSTLTFEEVSAFTLLLSTGRLSGPITVASPPNLDLLVPRPNVEMVSKPDGSLILL